MADFQWDYSNPLKRCKGESAKANQAVRDYCLMGAGRSLRSLHKSYVQRDTNRPPTTKWTTIETWSRRYEWVDRAARFDELENEARLERRQQRIKALEDADWKTGGELREAAINLLTLLMQGIEAADGDITALNVSLSQIVQAAKLSSDLQRLSTNEPTENVSIQGAALDSLIARELARLADTGQARATAGTEAEE